MLLGWERDHQVASNEIVVVDKRDVDWFGSIRSELVQLLRVERRQIRSIERSWLDPVSDGVDEVQGQVPSVWRVMDRSGLAYTARQ